MKVWMKTAACAVLLAVMALQVPVSAQETGSAVAPEAVIVETEIEPAPAANDANPIRGLSEKSDEMLNQVDSSREAKEISAGILDPIYDLAEAIAFPAFHWVAFALMVSGVISFALQLVLGKLVVLMKAGFDLGEILMDAQSLLISLIGLVLTTQAAAQNSTFTQSPAAVLSSAGVGAVIGFVFYLWGQSKEIQALKGRRAEQFTKRD